MAHEIIMPALGMAQDTGVIVAWHKKPGEAVRADEVLAEVETDKTTMEIDVGHDGFLACIMADAGAEVPVGDTIAIVAATQEEAGEIAQAKPAPKASGRAPAASAAEPAGAMTPSAAVTPAPAPTPSVTVASPAPGGRILASPKTRRLARERGIDLRDLVAQGLPQPFHAADLDKLSTATVAPVVDEFEAEIDARGFDSFHRWLATKGDGDVPVGRIWAAFGAACLRETNGGPGTVSLCVRVTSFGPAADDAVFENPDRSGLLNMVEAAKDAVPDLLVFDLTGTSLSNYRAGATGGVPALIIARRGSDALAVRLQFVAERLPANDAAGFLDSVVARIREPLLQLL